MSSGGVYGNDGKDECKLLLTQTTTDALNGGEPGVRHIRYSVDKSNAECSLQDVRPIFIHLLSPAIIQQSFSPHIIILSFLMTIL